MTVALSDYTKNKLLDWWFRGTAWSVPTTQYWRLFTANPNWATGAGGTELTGGTGYTTGGNDCTITTFWNQTPAAQGTGFRITNTGASGGTDVTWTASADWSAITGVGLYAANTGSDLIMGGAWSADPGNGDTVRISSGAIDIDLDASNAAGFTDYLVQQFLKKVIGATTDTPPSNYYVRLYTTTPNVKTGAGGTEVSGGSYVMATVATPFADAASGGATQNVSQIDFPTASASWGTVVGSAITDATPTNRYAVDSFTGVVMDNGDDFYIADGAFDLGFTDVP